MSGMSVSCGNFAFISAGSSLANAEIESTDEDDAEERAGEGSEEAEEEGDGDSSSCFSTSSSCVGLIYDLALSLSLRSLDDEGLR